MGRSLRVRQDCISDVKQALRRNGYLSQKLLAEEAGFALATVNNFLNGRPIDYATFEELCRKLGLDWQEVADVSPLATADQITLPQKRIDDASLPTIEPESWGDALDVTEFYGRSAELAQLRTWMLSNACRLIVVLGIGGIGKTTLAIRVAKEMRPEFEFVVWRSLRNAPPIADLLGDILGVLLGSQGVAGSQNLDGTIAQLIALLQRHRCLLVLDNAESVLETVGASAPGLRQRAGSYRVGYEGYGQLLRSLAEVSHQSCVIVTSREKPRNLGAKEGGNSPIRSLRLAGLMDEGGQQLMAAMDIALTPAESQTLLTRYDGNPLALRMVGTTIRELFDGDTAAFLAQGTGIFGDVAALLNQQFNRLSQLEQQVMVWLAINREWTGLTELLADIVPTVSMGVLMEAVESLQLRSLLEKSAGTFTQQSVVMEYMIDRLIERAYAELIQNQPYQDLHNYALLKAQAKDYVRESQARLILQPIAMRLLRHLGSTETVAAHFQTILEGLRAQPPIPGYTVGNLVNLLRQLQVDLRGYDFSGLTVWQAHLRGMNLPQVNFTNADLTKSVFTQMLGDALALAFRFDGQLLATAIDQVIYLWDIEGRHVLTLRGHEGWVQAVAFSPDGKVLASGGYDQTVRLWNVETGQCIKTLRGHQSWVQTIAFSSNLAPFSIGGLPRGEKYGRKGVRKV